MKIGRIVSFVAAGITGFILGTHLPIVPACIISLSAGIGFGFLGSWYDNRD